MIKKSTDRIICIPAQMDLLLRLSFLIILRHLRRGWLARNILKLTAFSHHHLVVKLWLSFFPFHATFKLLSFAVKQK